jgi:hypothetical protein
LPTYDSTSCLSFFNEKAGRSTSDVIADATKYLQLARAQQRIVARMVGVVPKAVMPIAPYTSMPQFFSADQQVFTLGNDLQGFPLFPFGKGGVYASLNDIPDNPWVEGIDYINEGTQIRIPNNGTYSGTLYWYGVTLPPDISGSTQPVILPNAARELIVLEAVRQFSMNYLRQPDLAAAMAAEIDGPMGAWPTWCLAWKTQYKSGGAIWPWWDRVRWGAQNQ